MRRSYFLGLACGLIASLASAFAVASERIDHWKPMAVYAVQAVDMDWAGAAILPDVQTETMVAMSTDESTRAALASRCCGKASAPVSADRTAIAFVQSFRHRHHCAGRGGLASRLVRPNNDGLTS